MLPRYETLKNWNNRYYRFSSGIMASVAIGKMYVYGYVQGEMDIAEKLICLAMCQAHFKQVTDEDYVKEIEIVTLPNGRKELRYKALKMDVVAEVGKMFTRSEAFEKFPNEAQTYRTMAEILQVDDMLDMHSHNWGYYNGHAFCFDAVAWSSDSAKVKAYELFGLEIPDSLKEGETA